MLSAIISRLVTLGYGALYPAFFTAKALRNGNEEVAKRERKAWLEYWIVFALYIGLEQFADIFAGFWFPFYYELKTLFVISFLAPSHCGGSVIYRNIVKPLFLRHEEKIDETLEKLKAESSNILIRWGKAGFLYFQGAVTSALLRIQIPSWRDEALGMLAGYDDSNSRVERHRVRFNAYQARHDGIISADSDTEDERQDRRPRKARSEQLERTETLEGAEDGKKNTKSRTGPPRKKSKKLAVERERRVTRYSEQIENIIKTE